MNIDPRELSQVPNTAKALENIKSGGIFYRKEPDGTFSKCRFDEQEMQGERGEYIIYNSRVYLANGLLYVRRDKHWVSL